jgi:predicted O-methyltransferase YrrM
MDQFLDSRYEWQAGANGAEWPYYRFFHCLAAMLQPGLTVELGGFQGTAAAHFAAGWPNGKVITIDHHTDPGDEFNKTRMVEAAARYDGLHYIQGWTNPVAAKRERGRHHLGDAPDALPQVRASAPIDILFLDSWHTYDNAMLDWQHYQRLMNSPGLVICDDIQGGGGADDPIQGMLDFWNEIYDLKFLNANLHPGTNLGFVKV